MPRIKTITNILDFSNTSVGAVQLVFVAHLFFLSRPSYVDTFQPPVLNSRANPVQCKVSMFWTINRRISLLVTNGVHKCNQLRFPNLTVNSNPRQLPYSSLHHYLHWSRFLKFKHRVHTLNLAPLGNLWKRNSSTVTLLWIVDRRHQQGGFFLVNACCLIIFIPCTGESVIFFSERLHLPAGSSGRWRLICLNCSCCYLSCGCATSIEDRNGRISASVIKRNVALKAPLLQSEFRAEKGALFGFSLARLDRFQDTPKLATTYGSKPIRLTTILKPRGIFRMRLLATDSQGWENRAATIQYPTLIAIAFAINLQSWCTMSLILKWMDWRIKTGAAVMERFWRVRLVRKSIPSPILSGMMPKTHPYTTYRGDEVSGDIISTFLSFLPSPTSFIRLYC